MKFTSTLGGIQQAGAPETPAKNVRPTIYFYLRLVTTSAYSRYKFVFLLSPTSTRSL